MNGLHDMGGQHGYGPVNPDPNEPLFHGAWEARALAITLAMGAHGKWSLDRSRFARETLTPTELVTLSYYHRWIAALEALMLEAELITPEELTSGDPEGTSTPALKAEDVPSVLAKGGPTLKDSPREPAFAPGDIVRARIFHPTGHTRLPLYARGKTGEVVLYHGTHVFADSSARGEEHPAEPLYAVRFTARALWGEDAPAGDTVTLDLWEPYLERA
ncbi:MAG: nitrile hydratase subunit beta [Pseudomonadota bacterium]